MVIKNMLLNMLIIFLILNMVPVVSFGSILEEDNLEDEVINMEDSQNLKYDYNDKIHINARCAIAIDGGTNQILFEQNGFEIVPMASTTKIMTALIAINTGNLDREVEISKTASSIRGSKVGYVAGEKIKLRELLFGLMFKSGNDAAIAIAEDIGGSIEGFAKIMNNFAKSIGILNSHYESPHGLDSSKHYSSAYDLAILTSQAMKSEVFREICGEKTISKDKYNFTRDYQNINKILWKIPNANGVKTGYTGQAGKCLVSSVNNNGRNIIMVVLNSPDRWNQTEKLYNYVSENYTFKNENKKQLLETNGMAKMAKIVEDTNFTYGFKENEKIEIEVFNPTFDISVGDTIGKVSTYNLDDEALKSSFISSKNIDKDDFIKIIN